MVSQDQWTDGPELGFLITFLIIAHLYANGTVLSDKGMLEMVQT